MEPVFFSQQHLQLFSSFVVQHNIVSILLRLVHCRITGQYQVIVAFSQSLFDKHMGYTVLCFYYSTLSSGQSGLAVNLLKDFIEPIYTKLAKKPLNGNLELTLARVLCEF